LPKSIKNLLRFTLYLGTGIGILYLVFQRQNTAYKAKCALDGKPEGDCDLVQKILEDFSLAHWEFIFLVLVIFMVSNVSRAIRWQMLMEPLGIKSSFINRYFTIMIGYFANLGLPRIGEVVRAASLARYEDAKTNEVMGTVVVDRIIDMLSMILVVALAFLLDGPRIIGYLSRNADTSSMENLLFSPYLWILGFMGAGFFYLLYRYRDRYAQYPLAKRIIELLKGFWDGLKSVRKVKRIGWFVFHSVAIWVSYYLMTQWCFLAFDQTADLGYVAGLTTFVFGSFGMVIPAPGGMGTFQFLISEALMMYNIPGEDGFSFSMIMFFSVQIFCNILFGLIGLIMLPAYNRRRKARLNQ
jgi:glycosyltransferase 2 family protein